jgi:hypothetical protein
MEMDGSNNPPISCTPPDPIIGLAAAVAKYSLMTIKVNSKFSMYAWYTMCRKFTQTFIMNIYVLQNELTIITIYIN